MKYTFLICNILLLLFSSCAQTRFIRLDTRKPAAVTFPEGTERILLVDNAFLWIDSDTISTPMQKAMTTMLTDSLKGTMLPSLAKFMGEEGIYRNIELYPYYPRPVYEYKVSDSIWELPLSPEIIQDICEQTRSDILISVDFVNVEARLSREIERGKSLVGATKEGAVHLADAFTDAFIPKWRTEERTFYIVGKKDAYIVKDYVDKGDWENALLAWEGFYNNEQKDRKNKIKYAANLALACEYLDDVDNASKWVDIAFGMLKNKEKKEEFRNIVNYRAVLQKRVKEMPVLKQQLKIDDEDNDEMLDMDNILP